MGGQVRANNGASGSWLRCRLDQGVRQPARCVGQHTPKVNRKDPICFSPHLYRARNLMERFFNKIKQCRRIAARYDKLAANYPAFIKLASIRLWLRTYEFTIQATPPLVTSTPAGKISARRGR